MFMIIELVFILILLSINVVFALWFVFDTWIWYRL